MEQAQLDINVANLKKQFAKHASTPALTAELRYKALVSIKERLNYILQSLDYDNEDCKYDFPTINEAIAKQYSIYEHEFILRHLDDDDGKQYLNSISLF